MRKRKPHNRSHQSRTKMWGELRSLILWRRKISPSRTVPRQEIQRVGSHSRTTTIWIWSVNKQAHYWKLNAHKKTQKKTITQISISSRSNTMIHFQWLQVISRFSKMTHTGTALRRAASEESNAWAGTTNKRIRTKSTRNPTSARQIAQSAWRNTVSELSKHILTKRRLFSLDVCAVMDLDGHVKQVAAHVHHEVTGKNCKAK